MMRTAFAFVHIIHSVANAARVSPRSSVSFAKERLTSSRLPLVNFSNDLWFGVAVAAAHVERAYPNDPWVAWAQTGQVAAYKSKVAGPDPDMRLRFLEEPEVELDLAADMGVKVFRMGVEWGRLVPAYPKGDQGVQDWAALQRYREIILMAKRRKMKVMLTLFHHSMPLWSLAFRGWLEDSTVNHFVAFAKDVAIALHDVVDYWITFNEPHVWVLFSICAGIWPPGPAQPDSYRVACLRGALPPWNGSVGYAKAMGNIQAAHREFYEWAHAEDSPLQNPRIGVAHNVAFNEAYFVTDKPSQWVGERLFKFAFIDAVKGHLDWLGLNYYSKELIGGLGPILVETEEYSDSGRAIHPDGLFDVLMQFNTRFPQSDPGVKFKSIIVTENGVSDSTDIFRPAYLVEHLLAVREAQHQGVPVEGYVHWTVSDNWEWADGYCPKFGLVDVDRNSTHLVRTPRKSYELFKEIIGSGHLTQGQRDDAWELIRQALLSNTVRSFCRAADGQAGLDEPVPRRLSTKDWRFTKLSSAEDGCFWTPWAPEHISESKEIVAHTSKGTCDVMPDASARMPNHCRRTVTLHREKRCRGIAPVVEQSGAVCEGSRLSQLPADGNTSCGLRFKFYPLCCCDADGRCGFALHAPVLPSKMRYYCPGDLREGAHAKCEG